MSAIILLAIVTLGFLISRNLQAKLPVVEQADTYIPHGTVVTTSDLPMPISGDTFHHKDTGEKVEVISTPQFAGDEYTIRWPDGSIGYIHESSLKEFFE